MAIKLCSRKAVTIIELIVVVVTVSVVLLAVFSVMVTQFQYAAIFRIESALKGESIYIIERMKRVIANSEHVRIATPGTLPLDLFDTREATGVNPTGTFNLNGTTLTYTNATGTTETISNKIGALTFDDDETPGVNHFTPIYVLRINLQVQDPDFPDVQGANIITAIASRLSARTVENHTRNPHRYYLSIQGALDASEFVPGDEIRCMGANAAARFTGRFLENVSITQSVDLRGGYDNNFTTRNTTTTIDGSGAGSVIACSSSGSGINVTIDGFTIQNGTGTSSDGGICGGGIFVDAERSTIVISDNTITGNNVASGTTFTYGGGIYIRPVGTGKSSITILNNFIHENSLSSSTEASGGGIYAGLSGNNSTLSISNNNRINLNTVTGGSAGARGGGIFVRPVAPTATNINRPVINIADNIINGNTLFDNAYCARGGGIWFSCFEARFANVHIIFNEISDNIATGSVQETSWGGGIAAWAYNGSEITVANNTITGNTIADVNPTEMTRGGGILAHCQDINSSFIIRNNTVSGNTSSAGHGGGIMAWAHSAGVAVDIINNVIAGNSAFDGIGIFAESDTNSVINIRNNTITRNTTSTPPTTSGGVRAADLDGTSTINITNTICFGNDNTNINLTGTVNVSFSDVGDPAYTELSWTPPPPYPPLGANGNINKQPQYVNALGNNYHLVNDTTTAGNEYIIDGGTGNDVIPPGLGGLVADMGAYGGPGAE